MKVFLIFSFVLVQNIRSVLLSSIYSASSELDEKSIIQSIVQQENDVERQANRYRKVKPRTPQYPIEVLKQIELNYMNAGQKRKGTTGTGSVTLKLNNRAFTKPRDRLFHVWLPAEIFEADANQTQVRFQQTLSRNYFGNFTSCQITLTVRDDIQVGPRTYLKMQTHWQNDDFQHETIQTMHIVSGRKFHSFDITEFISSSLKKNLTKPNLITIGFQLIGMDFNRVFDVQVDMPIIMFFYGGLMPTVNDATPSNRKRRSSETIKTVPEISGRPSSQCQRRSFSVKPEEVDWRDVVTPRVLDLGYCSGTCPYPLEDNYYNFTLHSFLLDRYRLHALGTPHDFPKSTCVPLTYKPISVMETIGVDKIEAGVIYNLSVDTCGCR